MRVPVTSALLILVCACSSQPTNQDAPPSVATSGPAAPATEVVVPAQAPVAAESAAGEKSGGRIPSGYRLERRNGKELYCRNITTLGSRFAQKTCFTRAQLEEIQRRTDSTMDDMEKGMKVCGSLQACGGSD
jgi:hypothetical protein